ncbi:permease-like cell division protein FtsX [Candidatus Saccharibacteria bacterium]|nr:permease-like cell division protein FtsX [Candidatus Saccharibacteria bacterium]
MKNSTPPNLKEKYSKTPTKKRLKIMAKNSHGHFFRDRARIIKYGTSGFFRHIWLSLVATIVTTFTLVILFVTIIASVVLSSTADYMREKIDITVYFKPETTDEQLSSMKSTMESDPNVTNVDISNAQQEYDRFMNEKKDDEDIMNALKDEELQSIMLQNMQATMRIKVQDSSNLDSIKDIVDNNKEFKENTDPYMMPTYDVNSTQIATISSWADIAKNGGLVLSAIFLVISILVIFNTIRMAIFSRREEIYMEKLIGASNSFIRGPFLVEAEICGILAGILSGVIGLVAFNILAPRLSGYGIRIDNIQSIMHSQWLIAVFAASIILGWFINMISARLAVQKYLR